jgi:hypothetical protein
LSNRWFGKNTFGPKDILAKDNWGERHLVKNRWADKTFWPTDI